MARACHDRIGNPLPIYEAHVAAGFSSPADDRLEGSLDTLEFEPDPRQTCCCSRSFGEAIDIFDNVRDAVVTFASRVAEKIRNDALVAGAVQMFIITDRFRRKEPQWSASVTARLAPPTSSTPTIISACLRALESAWADGYRYRKAGVILFDLEPSDDRPRDLFSPPPAIRPALSDSAVADGNFHVALFRCYVELRKVRCSLE
jgi:hypothetical protein